MEKLTLTVDEAAQALGVHQLTLRKVIACGDLPAVRVGKRVLIPRKALERFLEGAGVKERAEA